MTELKQQLKHHNIKQKSLLQSKLKYEEPRKYKKKALTLKKSTYEALVLSLSKKPAEMEWDEHPLGEVPESGMDGISDTLPSDHQPNVCFKLP